MFEAMRFRQEIWLMLPAGFQETTGAIESDPMRVHPEMIEADRFHA
jgi:hypothetical protein